VLVRLAEIDVAELEELITETWLAQAPKTKQRNVLQEEYAELVNTFWRRLRHPISGGER
jgi:hypothetical protein